MSSEISSHEGRLNAVALTALHLAQQDVYYDQIIDPSNPAYNIGGYIRLKGQLNNTCFFQAISQLPEAFDLFRMRFHFSDAIPQCSFDNPPLRIPVLEKDFSQEAHPQEAAIQWMQDRFQLVFDITNNEFIELGLLKINEEEHLMLFRYHHIFIDGHGIALLHHFIADKYTELLGQNGQAHPTDFPSYQEAILSTQEYLVSEQYQQDEQYWTSKFKELPQPLIQAFTQIKPLSLIHI